MRKVEEIGRFSIYVEERPSRDTYYLRYWDTDEHSYGDIFGSRAVISLKGTF